jgi:hypothetical protein
LQLFASPGPEVTQSTNTTNCCNAPTAGADVAYIGAWHLK